ncbi:hypothetical protein [Pseudomonas saxonica]|uniref:Uncharacterized protein n=1 Tax=Pseudomonas saxonica TaxID=2600598 RepID=A0A5C5Q9S2_9PSED|nr:hypothetical protein [Pseudomonas saxonica]TWS00491.1 hypothetical protein FJD37_01655 [Pseudomonas saxonica]
MEEKIDEEIITIWPVYEVAKFRCPKCEGVFTLSIAEVSKLLLEQPLKCLQGEHLIALGEEGIDDLVKRQRCIEVLNSVISVVFVVLLILSLVLAFAVASEAGAFVGASGTVILGFMRYYCTFGKPAVMLVAGKLTVEKIRPLQHALF